MHLAKNARDYHPKPSLQSLTTRALSAEALTAMLQCGLTWYWKSSHTKVTFPAQPKVLPMRLASHLTRNRRVLMRDLDEVVQNGNQVEYRNVLICGLSCCLESPLRIHMESAIFDFLFEHQGPIQVLIIRKADCRDNSILFYDDAYAEVKYLLDRWCRYIMTPTTGVSQQDLEAVYRTITSW
jgi:hypothetical protein